MSIDYFAFRIIICWRNKCDIKFKQCKNVNDRKLLLRTKINTNYGFYRITSNAIIH